MRIKPEGSDIAVYRVRDERIYHYILKKSITSCKELAVKLDKLLRSPQNGQLYLEQLRKKLAECQTLLLLGEPDYIQLYLSHYPIVEKSFLLDIEEEDQEDEEMVQLAQKVFKEAADEGEEFMHENLSAVSKTSSAPSSVNNNNNNLDTMTALEERTGGLYAIPEEDDNNMDTQYSLSDLGQYVMTQQE